MVKSEDFIKAAANRGFVFYSGVPCSYLKSLIELVIGNRCLKYVAASNEGEAVALCSGAVIAGKKSIVMLQNSGLGNAINPLTSFNHIFRIPVLLIVTWRGEPGLVDEPQHELMGQITPKTLELIKIPWEFFPDNENKVEEVFSRAEEYMRKERRPYALIMRKGSVSACDSSNLGAKLEKTAEFVFENELISGLALPTRMDMLRCVIEHTPVNETVVIATTGFTARELYAIEDRPNHLYMVGSMGCALPLGLGLAMNVPEKRVVVLDGDGALLMHLGAMAMVGNYSKGNFTHILFDNESYLSTGAQPTTSYSVDLSKIAAACGYKTIVIGNTVGILDKILSQGKSGGDCFIHLKVSSKTFGNLPRPSIHPSEVVLRLQKQLMNADKLNSQRI